MSGNSSTMTRYIFITGGVVSSLGKGLASAALGAILKARGYSVRMRKLDPYLNLDPGTMSPYQHGEVFVTDDGAETDLDLGHYERFTGFHARKTDNITAGRIYQNILEREREGGYLGNTVQVIPHVTDEIKAFILNGMTGIDFALIEIGGTVGDIEALPFFEAIRQLGNELPRNHALYLHLTLVPFIASAGELKTKPTQHSAKELRSIGIQPDILLLRADRALPASEKKKIARFCNVRPSAVIEALDAGSIYDVPLAYSKAGLDREVLAHFHMEASSPADLSAWERISTAIHHPEGQVTVGIVGKYTILKDAYKSLIEALTHAGIANCVHVNIEWIDSGLFETEDPAVHLQALDAILVPGGFGKRGTEGKIKAIEFARTRQVPYLGICLGMQLAVIESCRNLLGLDQAGSSEFVEDCSEPVVGLLTEWAHDNKIESRSAGDAMGGTLRLGAYPAHLEQNSLAAKIYQNTIIEERHRHRYEINIAYRDALEVAGMRFSGLSPDGALPEVIELKEHPWFVGVQYHPELKSKPFDPHPLFTSYIKAALKQSRMV